LTTTGTNYALTAASINITSKGILTANGSIVTITYFSGTPFTVSGTFNYGASTLIFNGDGPITIASTTYYNLTLSPAITTSRIYTGGGAITVNNNLNISIYSETIPAPTFTFNLGGATSVSGVLTIESLLSSYVVLNTTNGNYSLTMGSLSIQLHGTLTGNASALDSNGDVTIAATGTLTSTSGNFNVAGNWSNSGTFTHSSGTVIFDAGAGSKTIASGGSNFYNVTFNNAAGGWSFSDATTIAHDLVMTAGTLSQTSDLTLTVNGDLKGTAGAINYTNGTAKQTVAADKNFGPTTASTNWTFKNLTFSNSSASDRTITVQSCATCGVTVSSVLTIGEAANSNLTILSAGDKTWTLSGTGTPFVITATKGQFTASTSTVKYTGNGATNITVATYNNLEFSPSIDDDRIYTGAGAITVGGTLNINPSATAKSLTFLLGGITSVTGATTIQTTSTATSILDTKSGNDYTFNTGSLTIKAGGTLNGRASTLDSNGDVTIEASGTLIAPSSSGSFNIGGSWSNSATGVFTHSSGTVTFDATTTGKTISDGGDPFYNIVFNGSGGGWIYQDGTDGINQTTVSNGTVIYLNTKTGTQPVSVTGGTLNVDWYLGVLVVDASNTNTKINTGDNDITISENSTTPASTIWEWSGSDWDSPASSKTIGTDSDGIIPSPGTNGAIRIREYSNTSGSPTYYKYNLAIVWQSTYGEYNYYTDYGQNYITSTANTGSGEDEVIDNDYKRTTPTNQNIPEQAVNKPPTNGSWYVGMFKGLEVTIAGTSIDFGTLDAPNFSATAGTKTNITVTTSATSGYIVTAWEDGLMKCSDSIDTIQNFTGSYADPREWSGYCKDNTDYCGFGFTSSDPSVGVVNPSRYSGATAYTFFPTDSSAPVLVMDFDGPVASQSYLITYRISASLTQRPGFYSTTIVYIVTAQY
jgi:adhesin HecA-like repeat protein